MTNTTSAITAAKDLIEDLIDADVNPDDIHAQDVYADLIAKGHAVEDATDAVDYLFHVTV